MLPRYNLTTFIITVILTLILFSISILQYKKISKSYKKAIIVVFLSLILNEFLMIIGSVIGLAIQFSFERSFAYVKNIYDFYLTLPNLIMSLKYFVIIISFPSFLAIIISSLNKPYLKKIWTITLGFTIIFIVYEMIERNFFNIDSGDGSTLFITIVLYAFGTFILGTINVVIFELYNKHYFKNSSYKISYLTKFIETNISSIVFTLLILFVFTTVVLLITSPVKVDLTLTKWKTIKTKLYYSMTEINGKDYVDVEIKAKKIYSSVSKDTLKILSTYGFESEDSLKMAMETREQETNMNDIYRNLLFQNRLEYNKKMKKYYKTSFARKLIECTGNNLDFTLINERPLKDDQIMIYFPPDREIMISQDSSLLMGFTDFNQRPPKHLPGSNLIIASAEDFLLHILSKGDLSIFPNLHLINRSSFNSNDNFFLKNEIDTVSYEDTTQNISGLMQIILKDSKYKGEVIRKSKGNQAIGTTEFYFLKSDDSKYIETQPVLNNMEIQDCELKLDDKTIGYVYLAGAEGNLKINNKEYKLAKTDELWLTGKKLYIDKFSKKYVHIAGSTKGVMLNNEELTQTMWNSIDIEIRAAIIGGIIALFGIRIGVILSRRKKRKKTIPE